MRGKLWFSAATAALLMALPAAAQDQPGDNSTTATLSLGATIDGAIDPAADVDWYRLRLEQGQRYTVTLDGVGEPGQAVDPMLSLYINGEQVAFNDDANGTLNAQMTYIATASGEAIVEARAFSEAATGAYRLTANATPLPADDAGNDSNTRARITAGRTINGAIEYEGDVDWYRLSTRTDQRYRIALSAAEGANGSLTDPYLRIIGADGEELAGNDDTADSLNSAIDFVPRSNGDVFIEASAYANAYEGAYTLNVTAERLPRDATSADRNTRGRLSAGQTINASLDFPTDHDWYRIRLEEGQSYRFRLARDGDNALGDPLIKIYGADGAELAMDDDGGGNLNSYLEFTAPTTGNYFVEARGFSDDATGDYALTAQAGDTPADTTTDVSLSADGDFREGLLSPAGDRDWYRLDLAEGQGVRISLTSAESGDALADPYLVIHGPDGAEIVSDDDGGEGLNSWLEFVAATPGAHFVEVRGFSEDAAGRYYLNLIAGEIGATPETAEYIAANSESRASTIGTGDDVDWYAVELVEGRPYRFYVDATEPGALADPVLTLYNQEGQQVAVDDDGGAGLNSYLSFLSPAGGAHYAAVSSYGGGTGRYYIRVVDTDVPGTPYMTDEYLDAAGDERLGAIEISGDLDSYRVELEVGVRYTIDLRGHGENPLADPYLAVLGMDGERVAADDDSGNGNDSRLRFTPRESGSFFLQASGLGGATGGYQIVIARQ